MGDPFDTPPLGYTRAGKGWMVPTRTPQSGKIQKLEKDKAALSARLDEIESKFEALMIQMEDSSSKKVKK
jgi:hypothetical protein